MLSVENIQKMLSYHISEISNLEFIYEGAYSIVCKAIKDDKDVIIKFKIGEGKKYIKKEINILSDIEHENVVKMIDYVISDVITVMITEFCYDKDLLDFYNEVQNLIPYSRIIILQLVNCVDYLHRNNITHNDIKPDNIIFNPNKNKVTLIDFAFSKKHKSNPALVNYRRGTNGYVAPEIWNINKYDPYKSDIYSLGVVLHLCFTNSLPNKTVSDLCPFLIKRMLNTVPDFRPDIDYIKSNINSVFKIPKEKYK